MLLLNYYKNYIIIKLHIKIILYYIIHNFFKVQVSCEPTMRRFLRYHLQFYFHDNSRLIAAEMYQTTSHISRQLR